jgi:hypothetical protein
MLSALLDEAAGRNPQCPYHERLVNRLTSGDTILGLNYDWLADHTLKQTGTASG